MQSSITLETFFGRDKMLLEYCSWPSHWKLLFSSYLFRLPFEKKEIFDYLSKLSWGFTYKFQFVRIEQLLRNRQFHNFTYCLLTLVQLLRLLVLSLFLFIQLPFPWMATKMFARQFKVQNGKNYFNKKSSKEICWLRREINTFTFICFFQDRIHSFVWQKMNKNIRLKRTSKCLLPRRHCVY